MQEVNTGRRPGMIYSTKLGKYETKVERKARKQAEHLELCNMLDNNKPVNPFIK